LEKGAGTKIASERFKENPAMKPQDALIEMIAKNINYVLDLIPRALGAKNPKGYRKAKRSLKKSTRNGKKKVRQLSAKKAQKHPNNVHAWPAAKSYVAPSAHAV
jgi:hypothetical protein